MLLSGESNVLFVGAIGLRKSDIARLAMQEHDANIHLCQLVFQCTPLLSPVRRRKGHWRCQSVRIIDALRLTYYGSGWLCTTPGVLQLFTSRFASMSVAFVVAP